MFLAAGILRRSLATAALPARVSDTPLDAAATRSSCANRLPSGLFVVVLVVVVAVAVDEVEAAAKVVAVGKGEDAEAVEVLGVASGAVCPTLAASVAVVAELPASS